MSSTGRGAIRSAGDFYRTPRWAIEAILPELPASSSVVDPCCGDGAILEVLAERFGPEHVRGIEINPVLAARARARVARPWIDCVELPFRPDPLVLEGDCLSPETDWGTPSLVVKNPPFYLAEEVVREALERTALGGTVFALLRVGFLGSRARGSLWRDYPADLFVLPKRPSFTGGSTDSCDYGWFAWGPGRGGRWSRLEAA